MNLGSKAEVRDYFDESAYSDSDDILSGNQHLADSIIYDWSKEEAKQVLNAIEDFDGVLEYSGIHFDYLRKVSLAIQHTPVTHLIVRKEYPDTPWDQWPDFFNDLQESNLKELSLIGCGLTAQDMLFLELLIRNLKLDSLNLAHNRIDDEGLNILCDALLYNKDLKYLNLTEMRVSDEAFDHFMRHIKDTEVTHLVLNQIAFDEFPKDKLASLLEYIGQSKIKYLDLSGCALSQAQMESILKKLPQTAILHLNINSDINDDNDNLYYRACNAIIESSQRATRVMIFERPHSSTLEAGLMTFTANMIIKMGHMSYVAVRNKYTENKLLNLIEASNLLSFSASGMKLDTQAIEQSLAKNRKVLLDSPRDILSHLFMQEKPELSSDLTQDEALPYALGIIANLPPDVACCIVGHLPSMKGLQGDNIAEKYYKALNDINRRRLANNPSAPLALIDTSAPKPNNGWFSLFKTNASASASVAAPKKAEAKKRGAESFSDSEGEDHPPSKMFRKD